MAQLFTNNATSTLASGINDSTTSISLAAGTGSRFPNPTGGDYFYLTIFQRSGGTEINHEIVKVTARSTDTLTVVRAQEGTTALSFNSADPIELRLTTGFLKDAALTDFTAVLPSATPGALLRYAGAVMLSLRRANGSASAPTIVNNGEQLGAINFTGYDGASFVNAAAIRGFVEGGTAAGDMPGYIQFLTTPDGTSTLTERMRLTNNGRLFLGSTNTALNAGIVNAVAPAATDIAGVYTNPTISSSTTGTYAGYVTTVSTAAASFTLPSLVHFSANQATFGAGSVVSTQYGFVAGSSLTGAGTNVGFLGEIPSGSGRFNFYASGTADNYFAGNVGIGTSSPGSKLDVNGNVNASNYQIAGSAASQAGIFGFFNSNGPAIEVWGSSTANAGVMRFKTAGTEKARIDSSGNVGIGTASPGSKLGIAWSTNAGINLSDGTVTGVIYNTGGNSMGLGTTTNHPVGIYSNNTERLGITSDGRLYGTALHNNAGSVTGTTNQYIASGTGTPTATGVTNVASTSGSVCQWMRVGNVVTVSGYLSVNATSGGTTTLRIALPIASAFTTSEHLIGAALIASGTTLTDCVCYADATNDAAYFGYTAPAGGARDLRYTYTYQVL